MKYILKIQPAIFVLLLCCVLFINCTGVINTNLYPLSSQFKVGSQGPGKGIIFYDSLAASGKLFQVDGHEYRYLEVAPGDIGPVSWDSTGGGTVISGAYGTDIGSGKVNTVAIVTALGVNGEAAKSCIDYNGGNKSDWYLPSTNELLMIRNNLFSQSPSFGGFLSAVYYASSTQVNGLDCWSLPFGTGVFIQSLSTNSFYVRPIRAF